MTAATIPTDNCQVIRPPRCARLDSICAIRHGGTPSKDRPEFWRGSLPWASPKDMWVDVVEDTQDHISEEAVQQSATNLASEGALLVVIRSGILARRLPVAMAGRRLAYNQDIKALFPDRALIDPLFLFYVLRAYEPIILSQGVKKGPTVHSLKSGFIEAISVPLIPLPEQRRIAARLREQLSEVEKARVAFQAQLDATTVLHGAQLQAAFQSITPLSATPRSEAPGGWRWRELLTIARLESGHTPSRYHPEWWSGGTIPWIALPDIRALDGKVAEQTAECTNEAGIANSSARILPAGTVVLSRTASVGFVTILGRLMATSQDFVNWVCGPELEPRFLMYLLQRSRQYFRTLSSGAIHKTVYMPTLKQLHVCIPDVPTQQKIIAALDTQIKTVESLSEHLTTRLAALDHLPASLLREAFAGRL